MDTDFSGLFGTSVLLNRDTIDQSIDPSEIERNILQSISDDVDVANQLQSVQEEYESELNGLAKELGLDDYDNSVEVEAEKLEVREPREPHSENNTARQPAMSMYSDYSQSQQALQLPTTRHDNVIERQREHLMRMVTGPESEQFSQENRERQITQMIAEIDDLRNRLKGVENLANVQEVNHASSFDDIRKTLELLRFKQGTHTGGVMVREGITIVAKGAEMVLNGEREIFGFRPNLTGWTETSLPARLRGLHYDTGQVYNNATQNFAPSPWTKILMTIIPDMVLYMSRNNKRPNDRRITASDVRNAQNSLREAETRIV